MHLEVIRGKCQIKKCLEMACRKTRGSGSVVKSHPLATLKRIRLTRVETGAAKAGKEAARWSRQEDGGWGQGPGSGGDEKSQIPDRFYRHRQQGLQRGWIGE